MSKVSLEQIRAKLAQNKEKGGGERRVSSNGDNASYPFWNMAEGAQGTIRFLPDLNDDNGFFWVRREVIKMPFQGIINSEKTEYDTDREVTVQVPCMDMFERGKCPVVAATKKWWDDDSKKPLARVYWKKKSYITQGFVVNSPFVEDSLPENPIRRFILNPSIYDIVEQSIMDPEMEDMPTDYLNGSDFNIRKTKKGEYANYASSSFARRPRSLTEAEQAAVDTHGLKDLSEFLGRRPDSEELDAIKDMFWDSYEGRAFDAAKYGKYYRAFGGGNRGGGDDTIAAGQARVQETRQEPRQETRQETRTESQERSEPARETQSQSEDTKESTASILDKIRGRAGNLPR